MIFMPAFFRFARHVSQLGGASPLSNLMEVKDERSARASVARRGLKEAPERSHDSTNRNRIVGSADGTSPPNSDEVLHPSKVCAVNPAGAW